MRSILAAALAALLISPAIASDKAAGPAALKQKLTQIQPSLEKNVFGRPLHLESHEGSGEMKGDIYAVLDHPFAKVQGALSKGGNWCHILTLPFNMQRCEANGDALTVYVGRKPDSPIDEATKLEFKYAVPARTADYLEVRLTAPGGPAGTKDYRINFSATPLDPQRTLVHMGYGYAHGGMSKIAMQTYLSTSGADKVGFSSEGKDEQGKPKLVGGMRGVIERNSMRYFLAIDAYLDSLATPEPQRLRARLEKWFKATERYPRQLREMGRDEYVALKEKQQKSAG